MFIPESLYLLSARDQQVTWLEPFASDFSSSLAATEVIVSSSMVPDGRCLILQSCVLAGDPGAAQAARQLQLRLVAPGGGVVFLAGKENTPDVADLNRWLNWSGSILVPQDWSIAGDVTFSAGAAANLAELSVVGVLIPIGNIQRI